MAVAVIVIVIAMIAVLAAAERASEWCDRYSAGAEPIKQSPTPRPASRLHQRNDATMRRCDDAATQQRAGSCIKPSAAAEQ